MKLTGTLKRIATAAPTNMTPTDQIKSGLSDRIHKATMDGKPEVAAYLNEFREFAEPYWKMIGESPTYVVTAYRWGQRNGHSYVVSSTSDKDEARRIAIAHVDYRGGKYGCEVCEVTNAETEVKHEGNAEQVYFAESPYFGMAGNPGYFQPADQSKLAEHTRRESQKDCNALRLDKSLLETRANAAEAACAEMRAALNEASGVIKLLYRSQPAGVVGTCNEVLDRITRARETKCGTGWKSPEQAKEDDELIDAMKKEINYLGEQLAEERKSKCATCKHGGEQCEGCSELKGQQ